MAMLLVPSWGIKYPSRFPPHFGMTVSHVFAYCSNLSTLNGSRVYRMMQVIGMAPLSCLLVGSGRFDAGRIVKWGISELLPHLESELLPRALDGIPVAQWRAMPETHQTRTLKRRSTLVSYAMWFLTLLLVISIYGHLWILTLCLLSPLAAIAYWLTEQSKEEVSEMISFPAAEGDFAYSVKVSIVQDGAVTGVDWGRMWVQDNALLFTGNRCSFVIAAEEIERHPWRGKWLEPSGVDEDRSFSLWVKHPKRELRVLMTFVGKPPFREQQRLLGNQIGSLIGRYLQRRWTTTYPPLTLGSGVPRFRWDIWAIFGVYMFCILLLDALVSGYSIVLCTVFLALALWRTARAWKRSRIIGEIRNESARLAR
jgi:hypothetical protein